MPTKKMFFSICLTALLLLVFSTAALADDPPTRTGTIDAIRQTDNGIYFDATIQGELAQPLNPQLSTGTPDPSQIMDPSGGQQSVQLAAGMPVRLVIVRQNAVFRFMIGSVDQVLDRTHCTVRVDPAALNQTFQDPVNDNEIRKAGDFLKVGAFVAIWGVAP
jgi:hypothetical protein